MTSSQEFDSSKTSLAKLENLSLILTAAESDKYNQRFQKLVEELHRLEKRVTFLESLWLPTQDDDSSESESHHESEQPSSHPKKEVKSNPLLDTDPPTEIAKVLFYYEMNVILKRVLDALKACKAMGSGHVDIDLDYSVEVLLEKNYERLQASPLLKSDEWNMVANEVEAYMMYEQDNKNDVSERRPLYEIVHHLGYVKEAKAIKEAFEVLGEAYIMDFEPLMTLEDAKKLWVDAVIRCNYETYVYLTCAFEADCLDKVIGCMEDIKQNIEANEHVLWKDWKSHIFDVEFSRDELAWIWNESEDDSEDDQDNEEDSFDDSDDESV